MGKATFADFLRQREAAENAYVRGDGTKVDAIVPHTGSASLHTLAGETITGAEQVAAYYLDHAKDFRPNGITQFEVIHQVDDGNVAFWTGFQIATVQLRDAEIPVCMRIRVTEVFREIGGTWKMIHRHADVSKEK